MQTRRKGQISAEMIIILAILLGVVLLIANKMRETASTAAAGIETSSNQTFNTINRMNQIACDDLTCDPEKNDCCTGYVCSDNRCVVQ